LFPWQVVISIPKRSSVHNQQDNKRKHSCVVVRDGGEKKISIYILEYKQYCVY